MPRDANGSYSLPPTTLVNAGDTIQPNQHNPFAQDVASALSGSLSRDGLGGMRAPLNMGGFQIGNIADPSTGQQAATKNYVDNFSGDFVPLTGATMTGALAAPGITSSTTLVAVGEAYSDTNKRLVRINEFGAGANGNGWYSVRPDGNGGALIEQWGTVILPASGSGTSSANITFPFPFSNAVTISIVGSPNRGPNNTWNPITLTIDDPTTTGSVVRGDSTQGGDQFFLQTVAVRWRAVGY